MSAAINFMEDRARSKTMGILIYLIPLALLLGGIGLAAFIWSLKSGQYDDMDGAALRILIDDDAEENAQDAKPTP